ncbi:MAG TPA: energy transducer TonB [Cytophagales bacterium]|nr:energy transducer TonB [Cytophagales bacterium]HAA17645.1 energy transducer TonB [Cytophagales bacterium]HAP63938.1 energy transducer TonB [Cytophagales bacterium]
MSKSKTIPTDWVDLIYEGRHQAYGSYQLRKQYPKRLVLSYTIAFSTVVLAFVTPWLISLAENKSDEPLEMKQVRIMNYSELSAPPPIERTPPPMAQAPTPQASKKFLQPVVKPDEEVPEEYEPLPTLEELKQVNISTVTVEAPDSIINDLPGIPSGTEIAGPGSKEEAQVERPFLFAEIMPEFPGGQSAMYAYLAGNLKYPPLAARMGIEGAVYLRFVVGKNGVISNIEVLKGLEGGLTEEAIRVVETMPKWRPGRQNGRKVDVVFTLPIRFKLKEEQ